MAVGRQCACVSRIRESALVSRALPPSAYIDIAKKHIHYYHLFVCVSRKAENQIWGYNLDL